MSDNGQPIPRVELVIRLMPDGQVLITGPLQDKILCHGLLAVAGDLVRSYRAEGPPRIVPATSLQFARGA